MFKRVDSDTFDNTFDIDALLNDEGRVVMNKIDKPTETSATNNDTNTYEDFGDNEDLFEQERTLPELKYNKVNPDVFDIDKYSTSPKPPESKGVTNIIHNLSKFSTSQNDKSHSFEKPRDFFTDDNEESYEDKNFGEQTLESKRSKVVDNVIRDMTEIDLSDELREDDEKIQLLDEIEILWDVLKEEDIDLSRIIMPTMETPITIMRKVRRSLRLKNNRVRSRHFAEEVLLASAYALEHVFDGEKTYFGRRPNLTGWPSTLNVKLRRMRFETSSLASNVMSNLNTGPAVQILMELIPSMILCARMRKTQAPADVINSQSMNKAFSRIISNIDNDV